MRRESNSKINVLISPNLMLISCVTSEVMKIFTASKDEFTYSKLAWLVKLCSVFNTSKPGNNITTLCFSYKRNQPNSLKTLSDVNSVSLPSPKCMEVR